MNDQSDIWQQLRDLAARAEKDKDLDDRLRMDRKAVWAEEGIDVVAAEAAIGKLRDDRINVWEDVLKGLEARGDKKA